MEKLYEKFKGRIDRELFEEIYNSIVNKEDDRDKEDTFNSKSIEFNFIYDKITSFKNKKTNKILSDITIKNYKNKYKKLEELHKDIIKDIVDDKDVDDIIKKIKEKYGKSYKDYITILIKIIDNVEGLKKETDPNVYKKLQESMVEGLEKREKQTDIKIEEEKVKINWEDYVSKVDKLLKDDETPLRIKILYLLYKELPLRDNFFDVLLTNEKLDNQEINYYNMKAKKFFLNKYKTEGKYGKQVYSLSSKLNNLIKQYYKQGHKYLIENDNNEKYTSLSKLVSVNSKKYFDIKFNINDIRKSVIAYYNENKSIEERKKLASKMLHDYRTQQEVYLRKQDLPNNYVITKANEEDINLKRKKFVKKE